MKLQFLIIALFLVKTISCYPQKISYNSILNEKIQVVNEEGTPGIVAIKDIRTKYIILDFWATWCSPCIANQKILEKILSKNPDSITVVTVSGDKYKRFLEFNGKWKTNLIRGIDDQKILFQKYNIQIIPTMIFLNTSKATVKVVEGQSITIDEFNRLRKPDYKGNDNITAQLTPNKVQDSLFKNIYDKSYIRETPFVSNSPSFLAFQKPMAEQRQRLLFVNHSVGAVYKFCYKITEPRVRYSDPYMKTYFCFDMSYLNQDLLKTTAEVELTTYLKKNHPEIKATIKYAVVDSCYHLVRDNATKIKASNLLTTTVSQQGSGLVSTKITIHELTNFLEEQLLVPIDDKTGLKGLYDFSIDFKYEDPKALNRQLSAYGLKLVMKRNILTKLLMIASD